MKKLTGLMLVLALLLGMTVFGTVAMVEATETAEAEAVADTAAEAAEEVAETAEAETVADTAAEAAEEVDETAEDAIEEAQEASGGFLDGVAKVNGAVNNVVWGVPALILLAFVGVLMTCLTKVFQLSHIKHWMSKTIGAVFHDKHVTGHTKDKSISQFQSLCTALAATVGTGNIVGVSGAILMGGPGAVFWMWIMAFLGMITTPRTCWASSTAARTATASGPAARCTTCATAWAATRAARSSARCWRACSPRSAWSLPSASAT